MKRGNILIKQTYSKQRLPPSHASWDIHHILQCHPCTWGNRGNRDGELRAQRSRNGTSGRALPWLKMKVVTEKNNSYTNSGHLWEAHNLSKEHQGCLAHKEFPGPGGWGGVGRASCRHSSPTPSQPRAIWEPTSVPCCPHSLTFLSNTKLTCGLNNEARLAFLLLNSIFTAIVLLNAK